MITYQKHISSPYTPLHIWSHTRTSCTGCLSRYVITLYALIPTEETVLAPQGPLYAIDFMKQASSSGESSRARYGVPKSASSYITAMDFLKMEAETARLSISATASPTCSLQNETPIDIPKREVVSSMSAPASPALAAADSRTPIAPMDF